MIGEVVELGGNRKEFGPRFHSHFPRHFTLIIFRPVESQGEGANGLPMVAGGEAKNGAGIQIGRASCRERVEVLVVGGRIQKKQERYRGEIAGSEHLRLY